MESDSFSIGIPQPACRPLLSIIIPFHIDVPVMSSVLSQRAALTDRHRGLVEVVLVADGPSATWPEEACCPRDEDAFRIVCVQNRRLMGPGPSRNVGIAAASAQFISFVDSDDQPNLMAQLKACYALDASTLSVARFAFEVAYRNREKSPVVRQVVWPNSYGSEMVKHLSDFAAPWSYIFSLDFLCEKEIHFPDWSGAGEDIVFLILVSRYAKLLLCVDDIGYMHNMNSPNQMTAGSVEANSRRELLVGLARLNSESDSRAEKTALARWFLRSWLIWFMRESNASFIEKLGGIKAWRAAGNSAMELVLEVLGLAHRRLQRRV